MKAEIINIGEELLIGQVVNTNATWIAQRLNEIAIPVTHISIISDNANDIMESLKAAAKRSDLVLITGGLGPTKDDVTKDVLAKYFNTELELNKTVLSDIKIYFQKREMEINELNYLQAMVPKGFDVIRNPEGTAPGLISKKEGKTVIALPGVPYEMKYMIENHIIPGLKKSRKKNFILHKTVLTQGIPESFLAEKLEVWENELPSNLELAYLPSAGTVRLRLTCKSSNKNEAENTIKKEVNKLKQLIPEYIYGYDNDSLEEIIIKSMSEKKLSLGIAESCTGGYLSHLLTSISGSSKCFKGTIVSYSNESKERLLNIPSALIEAHGSVSSQVAEAMAEGARKKFETDYGIGVTGIAGPSGGSKDKPIGLVYIAISDKNEVISEKFLFGDKRERNIIRSSLTALNMLRKRLVKH